MIEPSIPASLRDAIARELEPDEKVVWSGMPKPWCFNRTTVHTFLFGIAWTALTVTWMAGITAQDLIPRVAFLFFFTIGILLLFSPLWAFRNSLKTVYVITDRRAITMDGGWTNTTRSYPAESLTEIYRKEHRDGTGDIVFVRHITKDSDGDSRVEELGFLHIPDVKSVEAQLKELAKQRAVTGNE
jgi:hypothetical protein